MSAKKKTDNGNLDLSSEMTPEELEAAANRFLEQADAELSLPDIPDDIDDEPEEEAPEAGGESDKAARKAKKPPKTPEEQIESLMKKGKKNGKLTQNELKVLEKLGLSEEAIDKFYEDLEANNIDIDIPDVDMPFSYRSAIDSHHSSF